MICAARAMAKALQVSIADQTSNVLGLDSAGEAPTASIQKSRIDIGNGDGIRVQNAQSFGWRIGYDWQPRVAYVESDDEYGEDEDAEWQGRSPLYPTVAWDRRERRAHVTNLLGGHRLPRGAGHGARGGDPGDNRAAMAASGTS